jgi:hypothetical protein
VIRHFWPNIRQYATHGDLLGRPRPGARRTPSTPLDAIIVPASRDAKNLDHAAKLASEAGCHLVVLCSLDAKGAAVAGRLASMRPGQAVVVDVHPGYRHPLLQFETSSLTRETLPKGCTNPNGDLSVKRNLGLLLARMVGWKRIFFMDDDIRGLASEDLATIVPMLDRYRIAGLRVNKFPDNSVVCHARRKIGDPQDVFVTGSALGVNCEHLVNFFPEIYNEDWFFIYDEVQAGRVGSPQRYAKQLEYDPFGNPRRARQQEFGDVLAEGLYALIHKEAGHEEATWEYWVNFIAARRKLIDDIKKRSAELSLPDRGNIVRALESAIACLMKIQPWVCESYVSAWRHDLVIWRKRLADISKVGSVEVALTELGLTQVTSDDAFTPDPQPAAGDQDELLARRRSGTMLIRQAAFLDLVLAMALPAGMEQARFGRLLRAKR